MNGEYCILSNAKKQFFNIDQQMACLLLSPHQPREARQRTEQYVSWSHWLGDGWP